MGKVVAINFKSYVFGNNALAIAKMIDEVAYEYSNIDVIITVSNVDLYRISKEVKNIEVFSQHVDNVGMGAHTGKIPIEGVLLNGARGIVINHSEDHTTLDNIEHIAAKAKEHNLKVLVCASTPSQSSALSEIRDIDYIAFEIPELIGTGNSITRVHPQSIKETVKRVRANNERVKLLVGSGISTVKDIRESLRLGADGVYISSAVMKATDVRSKLRELFII